MQDAPHDIGRLWELDAAALTQDESLRAYLIRQGFDSSQLRYADRTFVNAVGERIEEVSALAALAEIHETSNGSGDFRILDGYDHLIAHLAQGLDIRLDTPVNRIEWSAAGVKVHTTADVYEAQQVIITLPLGVLQSGTITFTPELPAHKLEAIHHLRMGPGLKMLYRFAEPILPPTVSALFSDCVPPMWWSPSFGQSTEQTVWTAFATGDWARQLLALGEAGALAQGLETLRYELGRPDLQPEAMRMMNWVDEPYTRGAYSVATPGFADVRDQIATPLDGVLYWAGEHTASHGNAATVHGAYTSGQRAAQEVLNRAR